MNNVDSLVKKIEAMTKVNRATAETLLELLEIGCTPQSVAAVYYDIAKAKSY